MAPNPPLLRNSAKLSVEAEEVGAGLLRRCLVVAAWRIWPQLVTGRRLVRRRPGRVPATRWRGDDRKNGCVHFSFLE